MPKFKITLKTSLDGEELIDLEAEYFEGLDQGEREAKASVIAFDQFATEYIDVYAEEIKEDD